MANLCIHCPVKGAALVNCMHTLQLPLSQVQNKRVNFLPSKLGRKTICTTLVKLDRRAADKFYGQPQSHLCSSSSSSCSLVRHKIYSGTAAAPPQCNPSAPLLLQLRPCAGHARSQRFTNIYNLLHICLQNIAQFRAHLMECAAAPRSAGAAWGLCGCDITACSIAHLMNLLQFRIFCPMCSSCSNVLSTSHSPSATSEKFEIAIRRHVALPEKGQKKTVLFVPASCR